MTWPESSGVLGCVCCGWSAPLCGSAEMLVPTLAGIHGLAKVTIFEVSCVTGVETTSGNIPYSHSWFGSEATVVYGGSYGPTCRNGLTSIDLGGP